MVRVDLITAATHIRRSVSAYRVEYPIVDWLKGETESSAPLRPPSPSREPSPPPPPPVQERRRAVEEKQLRRNVKRFRGRLVFEAHRLVYHSTRGTTCPKSRRKGGGA